MHRRLLPPSNPPLALRITRLYNHAVHNSLALPSPPRLPIRPLSIPIPLSTSTCTSLLPHRPSLPPFSPLPPLPLHPLLRPNNEPKNTAPPRRPPHHLPLPRPLLALLPQRRLLGRFGAAL